MNEYIEAFYEELANRGFKLRKAHGMNAATRGRVTVRSDSRSFKYSLIVRTDRGGTRTILRGSFSAGVSGGFSPEVVDMIDKIAKGKMAFPCRKFEKDRVYFSANEYLWNNSVTTCVVEGVVSISTEGLITKEIADPKSEPWFKIRCGRNSGHKIRILYNAKGWVYMGNSNVAVDLECKGASLTKRDKKLFDAAIHHFLSQS